MPLPEPELQAFPPLHLAELVNPLNIPSNFEEAWPLLIFKWFCSSTVDLLCVGPAVCDGRLPLQKYIEEWLLPK